MGPTFLIIGAPRCATTTMCSLLGDHPDVFMCEPKEPRFFSDEQNYAKGWGWYEALFAAGAGKLALGEGSVHYSFAAQNPAIVDRIATHLPDCRLIYMVRHPLKRMESGFRLTVHEDKCTYASFCDAVRRSQGLVGYSSYWTQLCQYRARFPDERILVVFFEEFVANPEGELARCFRHIGVDPSRSAADVRRHLNESSRMRKYNRAWRTARRLLPAGHLGKLVPDRVRKQVRKLLTHTEAVPTVWDEPTKRFAIERLSEEARQLLAFCGKPADFWNLERV